MRVWVRWPSRSLRSAPSGKLRDFWGGRARVGCFGLLCGCFEPAWTSHIDQKTHLYSILLRQHSKISDACGITPADTITKKDLFIGMENSSVLVHFDFGTSNPPPLLGSIETPTCTEYPPRAISTINFHISEKYAVFLMAVPSLMNAHACSNLATLLQT